MLGKIQSWNENLNRGVLRGYDGGQYQLIGFYLPRGVRPSIGCLFAFDVTNQEQAPMYKSQNTGAAGAINVRLAGVKEKIKYLLKG
jgi:hypothetical protein